jgi:hypothetical protein
MKKSELKNIIKECVKEVIFEEGVLSGIISEVANGLRPLGTAGGSASPSPRKHGPSHLEESKKEVLAAIGNSSYNSVKNQFQNPELFEGTSPIPSGDGKGPLSGVGAYDPGVDITNIPGFGSWGAISSKIGK